MNDLKTIPNWKFFFYLLVAPTLIITILGMMFWSWLKESLNKE
jgi:hypothetical protein